MRACAADMMQHIDECWYDSAHTPAEFAAMYADLAALMRTPCLDDGQKRELVELLANRVG